MAAVLFAIIGQSINANALYWVCCGIFLNFYVINIIYSILKNLSD